MGDGLTTSKWIRFIPVTEPQSRRVTLRFFVSPKDHDANLGMISWWPAWRRYAFSPSVGTVFESQCLRDISEFCDAQTEARKAQRG